MRLLGDYFEMVVRVVESPDILTMIPKTSTQCRGGWFGRNQEIEGESNLRKNYWSSISNSLMSDSWTLKMKSTRDWIM
jgi:hypothetical protein